MYYFLKEKLGDNWATRLIAIVLYTLIVHLIILYSSLPTDTFRYLNI